MAKICGRDFFISLFFSVFEFSLHNWSTMRNKIRISFQNWLTIYSACKYDTNRCLFESIYYNENVNSGFSNTNCVKITNVAL